MKCHNEWTTYQCVCETCHRRHKSTCEKLQRCIKRERRGRFHKLSRKRCVHLQGFWAQHKHAKTDQRGELQNSSHNEATAFHTTDPKQNSACRKPLQHFRNHSWLSHVKCWSMKMIQIKENVHPWVHISRRTVVHRQSFSIFRAPLFQASDVSSLASPCRSAYKVIFKRWQWSCFSASSIFCRLRKREGKEELSFVFLSTYSTGKKNYWRAPEEQAKVETQECLVPVCKPARHQQRQLPLALVGGRLPAASASSPGNKRWPKGSFVTWVVGLCRALVVGLFHALCRCLIADRRCPIGANCRSSQPPREKAKSLQVRGLRLCGHRHRRLCRKVQSRGWGLTGCQACLTGSTGSTVGIPGFHVVGEGVDLQHSLGANPGGWAETFSARFAARCCCWAVSAAPGPRRRTRRHFSVFARCTAWLSALDVSSSSEHWRM